MDNWQKEAGNASQNTRNKTEVCKKSIKGKIARSGSPVAEACCSTKIAILNLSNYLKNYSQNWGSSFSLLSFFREAVLSFTYIIYLYHCVTSFFRRRPTLLTLRSLPFVPIPTAKTLIVKTTLVLPQLTSGHKKMARIQQFETDQRKNSLDRKWSAVHEIPIEQL